MGEAEAETMTRGAAVILLVTTASCATQPHDAAWARRQIIESQCRAWASGQARAEFGPQIQEAARQQRNAVRSGYAAGAGVAGANVAVAQLAQQGRENDLYEACLIERGAR